MYNAVNLETFSMSKEVDFGKVQSMNFAFTGTAVTDIPSLSPPFYRTGSFTGCWANCTKLKYYRSGFIKITATNSDAPFQDAFFNCALTPESIEGVLEDVSWFSVFNDGSNGQPAPPAVTQVNVSGGTNAPYSQWTAGAKQSLTALEARGWTVLYNE